MNRHKAKCKEKDKPPDNNEHKISSTSNDDTTASRAIETGNIISGNTIDMIYDKVAFRRKNFSLLPSGSCGKRYTKETNETKY